MRACTRRRMHEICSDCTLTHSTTLARLSRQRRPKRRPGRLTSFQDPQACSSLDLGDTMAINCSYKISYVMTSQDGRLDRLFLLFFACTGFFCSTNSARFALPQCLTRPGNVRWACPSGRWLVLVSGCSSTCPPARRSPSARATDCA